MNVKKLQQYISETYGADAEHPWIQYSDHTVFRHGDNRKRFCLIMNISKKKLGLPEKGAMDVLNVKCEPLMIGSLRSEPGIYPAYHMNKADWITAAAICFFLSNYSDNDTTALYVRSFLKIICFICPSAAEIAA